MNLTSSIRVAFEDLRSLAFNEISGTYALVGTAFQNPPRMLKIYNNTDADLIISYNGGFSDQDYIPEGTGQIYDYGSNMSAKAGLLEQPAFQSVSVKNVGAAATAGSVYVIVVYAAQA